MKIGNCDVVMWAWDNKSDGATAVADALGINKLLKQGSKYQWKPNTVCIGWGNGDWPQQYYAAGAAERKMIEKSFLNKPTSVSRSINKLATFDAMLDYGVRTPRWTDSQREVKRWRMENPKLVIVARTTLMGHDGGGIILVEPGQPLPNAKLYVEYIEKDMEFRIHVFKGKVVDRCRKVFKGYKNEDDRKVDRRIRTSGNGILFQRDGLCPRDADEQAIDACAALELDFAGVDVITKGGVAYVLETNTAPEMLPIVTTRWCEQFKQLCAA
jgi:hypothetical protein